jgi:hypothetical protein
MARRPSHRRRRPGRRPPNRYTGGHGPPRPVGFTGRGFGQAWSWILPALHDPAPTDHRRPAFLAGDRTPPTGHPWRRSPAGAHRALHTRPRPPRPRRPRLVRSAWWPPGPSRRPRPPSPAGAGSSPGSRWPTGRGDGPSPAASGRDGPAGSTSRPPGPPPRRRNLPGARTPRSARSGAPRAARGPTRSAASISPRPTTSAVMTPLPTRQCHSSHPG